MRKGKHKRNKSLIVAEYTVETSTKWQCPLDSKSKSIRKNKAMKQEIWNTSISTQKRPKRGSWDVTKIALKTKKVTFTFFRIPGLHMKIFEKSNKNILWHCCISAFLDSKNLSFLKNPDSQFYPILNTCYQV